MHEEKYSDLNFCTKILQVDVAFTKECLRKGNMENKARLMPPTQVYTCMWLEWLCIPAGVHTSYQCTLAAHAACIQQLILGAQFVSLYFPIFSSFNIREQCGNIHILFTPKNAAGYLFVSFQTLHLCFLTNILAVLVMFLQVRLSNINW